MNTVAGFANSPMLIRERSICSLAKLTESLASADWLSELSETIEKIPAAARSRAKLGTRRDKFDDSDLSDSLLLQMMPEDTLPACRTG